MTDDQMKQARELAFSRRHSAGQWMVPGWDGHKCANLLDSLIAALATPAPAQPEGAQEDEPALWVSPEQAYAHTDLPDLPEAGRYLPCRRTPGGKFTMPLYTQSAGAAAPDEGEAKRWLVFNVGCIECGVSSNVVGRYASEDEARKVAEACEEVLSWREGGQNEFEVFDLHAAQPEEYVAALSAPKGEAA